MNTICVSEIEILLEQGTPLPTIEELAILLAPYEIEEINYEEI